MEDYVLKNMTEKYTIVERREGSPEILWCLCDPFTFLYEKDLDFDHQFVYSLYSICKMILICLIFLLKEKPDYLSQ